VEFDSGHCGHPDVGDQASGFDETRGCEKSAADEKASTAKPNDLMSLRMDSRKNRSSSTTETNDAFGIGHRGSHGAAIRVLTFRRACTVSWGQGASPGNAWVS
jgi:hypothetical protein